MISKKISKKFDTGNTKSIEYILAKTEHSHPLERFNPFTIEP